LRRCRPYKCAFDPLGCSFTHDPTPASAPKSDAPFAARAGLPAEPCMQHWGGKINGDIEYCFDFSNSINLATVY
jgi:hypothetical protein